MSQRRPQVCLSSVKDIIIQTLITYYEEISCCDYFWSFLGKNMQNFNKLVLCAYFFHMFIHVLSLYFIFKHNINKKYIFRKYQSAFCVITLNKLQLYAKS